MQAPGARNHPGEGIEWARARSAAQAPGESGPGKTPAAGDGQRQHQQEPFSQEEGPSGEPQDTPIPSEQGTPSYAGYSGKSVPPAH